MKRKDLTKLAAKIKKEAIKNHPNFDAVYIDNDYLEISIYIYLYCNKIWFPTTQETIIKNSVTYLKNNVIKGHKLALNELKNSLIKNSKKYIEPKQN
jgi:hypothetical protein